MLVLSRQPGLSIIIGDDWLVTVLKVSAEPPAAASILVSSASRPDPGEFATRTVDLVVGATHSIADGIDVTLLDVSIDKARLGVSAPKDMSVHRLEVYEAIREENRLWRGEDDAAGEGGAPVPRSPWPPRSPRSPPSLN